MSRHDRAITGKAETMVDAPTPEPVAKPPRSRRKRAVLGALALCVLVAGGVFARDYWTVGRFMVETDDAYVAANVALVSSRVQGYVAEVPVSENAGVSAGDVLVRLDDGDYRIALQMAQGRVATAGETLARIDAQIVAAQAGVAQAEAMEQMARAHLHAAQTNADRVRRLASSNVAAQAQVDTAVETLQSAEASVASAAAATANAEAQVGVLRAQRAEAEGTRHELELAAAQAQRNLDLTVLRAPADGTVTNLTLEVGDLVNPGTRLAALVPAGGSYVEANFKETQMGDVAVGADVHMTFDAAPDHSYHGTVLSVSPATGSVFSLLPADNATGNFTKIVQRVPVRISIPQEALEAGFLRAGLSVVVEVDSRTGGGTPAPAPAPQEPADSVVSLGH
ncbi:HlyD family secretion protein [Oceaniglobus trochenteri]|uniref:HlyD family secretion protein n=1 Tax=Oceaniglobus trochenteri TaxID=2763260 RepID=UPI001CFF8722|nr:HlyD family secretion protein [Oceaniglobus trochenteri]